MLPCTAMVAVRVVYARVGCALLRVLVALDQRRWVEAILMYEQVLAFDRLGPSGPLHIPYKGMCTRA